MKLIYPIKACPWCNITGRFYLDMSNDTWLAYVYCLNPCCTVAPKAKYVPIRKSQRLNYKIIKDKIEKCIENWNSGNLNFNNEGFEIDIYEIIQNFKKRIELT